MRGVIKTLVILSTFFLTVNAECLAQEGYDLKLTKPKKFETRSLGYEKTYTKKFGGARHFLQNTITHYNYFYNANLKIENVLKQAKTAHSDDFTQLLPFYNYSLNITAASQTELDSIIYKATAGIVLHDLRNDWIDNMYFLIGKAYFLKNQVDSAAVTFQFINYAFAPREKDGYAKIIASNASEGGNAFLVSTKEKNSLPRRAFSEAPSRNDALIWLIRSYIEQKRTGEAAGLMQALRLDPGFPERLAPQLAQMQAYYFYEQKAYDSAAFYLEKALPSAENVTETARWQFLIAQMHEKSSAKAWAIDWYNKAIRTTLNPVLDIYARLNAIRLNKEGGDNYIKENIEALYKMGRRDNYSGYRDIIYYTAGIMDKERANNAGVVQSMKRSLLFNNNNISLKNKALVELGNSYFQTGDFMNAKNAYDSILLEDPALDSTERIIARKTALGILATNIAVVKRQDSVQYLARLPENERDALLKNIVKNFNKGKKGQYTGSVSDRKEEAPSDLFDASTKGDWYFYNTSLRSKGANEFNVQWGNRPNADNWRRNAALTKMNNDPEAMMELENLPDTSAGTVTFESLLATIPLTPEKLAVSNDSMQKSMYEIANAYQVQLEEYAKAADMYEAVLAKFPNTPQKENVLYNLYYCYWKLGLTDKANRFKTQLQKDFPGSDLSVKLMPQNQVKNSAENRKKEATIAYEKVYNSFIEGDFLQAIAMKQKADSTYGQSYWTPQLLYIESIYHIKQRDDKNAMVQLDRIIKNFPNTPMSVKAETLKKVLSRRSEIEEYLTQLDVKRNEDSVVATDSSLFVQKPVVEEKNAQSIGVNTDLIKGNKTDISQKDLALNKNITLKAPVTPDSIIQKYKDVETAKNAKVDSSQKITKTITPPVKETISGNLPGVKAIALFTKNGYIHQPAESHSVVLVMNKVDPVYVSEARNAFLRYNRENYYNQQIGLTNIILSDSIRLLSFSGFADANTALQYLEKAKAKAGLDVIPWLPANKYSFLVISDKNLPTLLEAKQTETYLDFWQDAVKMR